jgi:fructuronate reductase
VIPRLSNTTLTTLAPTVDRPRYQRTGLVPGIVHFGPGAFHRAHQAAYVDAILDQDPRWSISSVALNSSGVADALRPQDGLYSLTLLGGQESTRIIGSVCELLTRSDATQIAARLAATETRLVTTTVTEKGYCLTADGHLDRDHPAIRRDLTQVDAPTSLIGWLVSGLSARRLGGAPGLTILSCDNLASNGQRLGQAVLEFATLSDPDLARWIGDNVRFPSSMVDSITPATASDLSDHLLDRHGFRDAWPIQRETFTQWVIEDDFAGDRPPFDIAGAQFVKDVSAFEEAKLRLLNGAHSSLAYLGILLGLETVSQAMQDQDLPHFVEQMMRLDIAPSLGTSSEFDVSAYIGSIIERFRNPGIRHLLSQIAWDGSQKLPFRLLSTIMDAAAAGRPLDRLVVPIAAWIRFLGLPRPPTPPVVDPLAVPLMALAERGADALIVESGIFPLRLTGNDEFRGKIRSAWQAMIDPQGIRRLL